MTLWSHVLFTDVNTASVCRFLFYSCDRNIIHVNIIPSSSMDESFIRDKNSYVTIRRGISEMPQWNRTSTDIFIIHTTLLIGIKLIHIFKCTTFGRKSLHTKYIQTFGLKKWIWWRMNNHQQEVEGKFTCSNRWCWVGGATRQCSASLSQFSFHPVGGTLYNSHAFKLWNIFFMDNESLTYWSGVRLQTWQWWS